MGYVTLLSNLLEKAADKHADVRAALSQTPGWTEFVAGQLTRTNDIENSYLGGLTASPSLSFRYLETGQQMLKADELDSQIIMEASLKRSKESTTPKIIKRSLAINKRLSDMDLF